MKKYTILTALLLLNCVTSAIQFPFRKSAEADTLARRIDTWDAQHGTPQAPKPTDTPQEQSNKVDALLEKFSSGYNELWELQKTKASIVAEHDKKCTNLQGKRNWTTKQKLLATGSATTGVLAAIAFSLYDPATTIKKTVELIGGGAVLLAIALGSTCAHSRNTTRAAYEDAKCRLIEEEEGLVDLYTEVRPDFIERKNRLFLLVAQLEAQEVDEHSITVFKEMVTNLDI